MTAAVAQSDRSLASHAKGPVYETQQRKVVKSGSDSSTAKRSATGVSVTGLQR